MTNSELLFKLNELIEEFDKKRTKDGSRMDKMTYDTIGHLYKAYDTFRFGVRYFEDIETDVANG